MSQQSLTERSFSALHFLGAAMLQVPLLHCRSDRSGSPPMQTDSIASLHRPEIDLRGKVAIVSGGGGSIGQSCAGALAVAGAEVFVADVSFSSESAASRLQIRCDVTSESEVRRLFAEVVSRSGGVDLLINCAGVLERVSRTVDQD